MGIRSWNKRLVPPSPSLLRSLAAVGLLLGADVAAVRAQVEATDEDTPVEMKATDIGVRFTPEMANAITGKFIKQMTGRYELNEDQAGKIQAAMTQQFMRFAGENAEMGRDFVEYMLATTIENEGRFTKESGQEFAARIKPLLPKLKGFFTDSAGAISKHMTTTQRLKFTGDMAGVTAGMALFEGRMSRWEKGELRDNANPFFDRQGDKPEDEAPPQTPEDPNEDPAHREVRQQVEQWIDWQINVDSGWERYVTTAIEYYQLNESQSQSARSILKECQDRIKPLKTPERRAAIVENRIRQQMVWKVDKDWAQGPWSFENEREFEQLRKPLTDIDLELKKRVDSLPDSKQRARVQSESRAKFEKVSKKKSA